MTRARTAVLGRAAGVLLGAFLALMLTPHAASACDVSYHYKPSFSLDQPNLGRGNVCSNSTSLAGAALVALLAMSALTAAGVGAVRRGEATAASLAGTSGTADALSGYLDAAGLRTAVTRTRGDTGERDANESP